MDKGEVRGPLHFVERDVPPEAGQGEDMLEIKKQIELIEAHTVDLISLKELEEKLKRGIPLKIKWGADPSAPDLHLGHTVVLRKLKAFQDLGHAVIFIIGDFTGMIGDPSGKSKTRKPLTKEEVLKNAETYKEQVFKILDPNKTRVVFNSEWLGKMGLEDLMRLSAQYSVARMLERADFRERFKEGIEISVLEFMYPLLQGYDSVAIEADVEIGGTDQIFNLLVGRAIQRAYGQAEQIVMTLPLLEGTDGKQKMSKSLGNYIGITEPPAEIFGKVMSIPDKLMIKYYELLTDLGKKEIAVIKRQHPKEAKKKLAKILVTQFYSKEEAENAEKEFEAIFKEGKLPQEIPLILVPSDALDREGSLPLVKLLNIANLTPSISEARRLIKHGGVKVNEEKITDEKYTVKLDSEKIISVGKRRYARVKVESS